MYYCTGCAEKCTYKVEDCGIGETEYMGRTSVHQQLEVMSDCCSEQVMEGIEPTSEEMEFFRNDILNNDSEFILAHFDFKIVQVEDLPGRWD